MLNRVSIGWVWLEKNLNTIIDEINLNRPLASGSIAIDHTPNGSVIKATPKAGPEAAGGGGGGPTPWKYTPDNELANWHQIQLMDSACNVYQMWVWGGTPARIGP
jgi:hypothetical protein